MAITVQTLIDKSRSILQDPTPGVRWSDAELWGWINDSYLAIIARRPDAHMTSAAFSCVQGSSEQALPVGALRLHAVTRNNESGDKSSIQLIQRGPFDLLHPNWRADLTTSTTGIQFYMYDPLVPLQFLVYPVPHATKSIYLTYCSVPTQHTSTSGNISLTDNYAEPVLNYVLYRAFSKDAESQSNATRAAAHFQLFENTLAAGIKSDAATAPQV